jgi:hypothetical protein
MFDREFTRLPSSRKPSRKDHFGCPLSIRGAQKKSDIAVLPYVMCVNFFAALLGHLAAVGLS